MSKKLTEYDKKVIAFLKSKRAFAKFKRNRENERGRVDNYCLKSAFIWENTPEGWGYWWKLDREFQWVVNNDN